MNGFEKLGLVYMFSYGLNLSCMNVENIFLYDLNQIEVYGEFKEERKSYEERRNSFISA